MVPTRRQNGCRLASLPVLPVAWCQALAGQGRPDTLPGRRTRRPRQSRLHRPVVSAVPVGRTGTGLRAAPRSDRPATGRRVCKPIVTWKERRKGNSPLGLRRPRDRRRDGPDFPPGFPGPGARARRGPRTPPEGLPARDDSPSPRPAIRSCNRRDPGASGAVRLRPCPHRRSLGWSSTQPGPVPERLRSGAI